MGDGYIGWRIEHILMQSRCDISYRATDWILSITLVMPEGYYPTKTRTFIQTHTFLLSTESFHTQLPQDDQELSSKLVP